MPLKIVRNDLLHMKVDAIVNPTNENMYGVGGIDGKIHNAEGDWLRKETAKFGKLTPGQVKMTKAKHLLAEYIIHTAGPVWQDGKHDEEAILKSCYVNALQMAVENDFESIAIPLIASGTNGYPKALALNTATSAIKSFLEEHELDVTLVVYDQQSFVVSEKLFRDVQAYIDAHYVAEDDYLDRYEISRNMIAPQDAFEVPESADVREDSEQIKKTMRVKKSAQENKLFKRLQSSVAPSAETQKKQRSLEDILNNLGESFSEMLFRLIDERNLTDPYVYKKANVSKQTFSKIRNNAGYNPNKQTVIALAIALELNMDETKDLLQRAGFALANNNHFDLIISYFIADNNYDVYTINEVLFEHNENLLGV